MKPTTYEIVMDRPIGAIHPKHPDLIYSINYGYVEGIIAPDGEEQDVYLLGIDYPVERFTAQVFAIIHRNDDVEEKWVACPEGQHYTAEQVKELTHFQEQYYDSYVIMLRD